MYRLLVNGCWVVLCIGLYIAVVLLTHHSYIKDSAAIASQLNSLSLLRCEVTVVAERCGSTIIETLAKVANIVNIIMHGEIRMR